ncbi:p53 and DNA damage-regulated protein 1-like isoform X2 [Portunus trituberculatus]|uniref:p53 and DNA damage-regulated protein 1-like isoform X2 n=1 Tax=Portunus trituberculatus TaxID=210409 RepID=UPI001E1CC7E5|nr:p53 and DNA damage-regulated protein 1-like isoform X2 [Portunus trituberculatus]
MAKSPEVVQQYLEEVEAAAEDILSDRQEIITLDRRRNTNREALRQLAGDGGAGKAGDSRMWICVGNMFLRMPTGFVKNSIEKEQKHLDSEINNLRNSLHTKVNLLNDLEHKQATVGTSLKPLSPEEWQAVRQDSGR